MDRAQKNLIIKDLEKKMVLLIGPRQAGKTWLAKDIANKYKNSMYLNYDVLSDREIIQSQSWLNDLDLLILDELHKMRDWKNYLKGLFDSKPTNMRILVTGSARQDIWDQLGDSLAGRYFRHRLLPFSMAELTHTGQAEYISKLTQASGFPEPILAQDDMDIKRWRQQYITSILSTDVFEYDHIQNVKAMKLIFEMLRHRVGSPISYQSIAEDVSISPTTVKKYIQILESLYVLFRVTPFSKNIARSILKEPKIYFFDTGLVEGDDGIKFENLVANCLLKHAYAKVDYHGDQYELHYVRTKEGDEVDFALSENQNLKYFIEAKLKNHKINKALRKFHHRYQVPAIQLVKQLRNEYQEDDIQVRQAERYLSALLL